jgi:hypothetical protein
MNLYTIVNWSTQETIKIQAINCEVENYQFVFYRNFEGKIIESCYSTRYWDIRKVDYEQD